jgi:hypothetical protein
MRPVVATVGDPETAACIHSCPAADVLRLCTHACRLLLYHVPVLFVLLLHRPGTKTDGVTVPGAQTLQWVAAGP